LFTQKVITTKSIRMVNTILKYCIKTLYSPTHGKINRYTDEILTPSSEIYLYIKWG